MSLELSERHHMVNHLAWQMNNGWLKWSKSMLRSELQDTAGIPGDVDPKALQALVRELAE